MDATTPNILPPRVAEYHISFTIGYQVYSHKVTGTIGGAYMHMGLLIERTEYEVNADRARRGLEPPLRTTARSARSSASIPRSARTWRRPGRMAALSVTWSHDPSPWSPSWTP